MNDSKKEIEELRERVQRLTQTNLQQEWAYKDLLKEKLSQEIIKESVK